MDDVITCISSWKLTFKSETEAFEWSEKEMDKDKSRSSEKTQVLGDGSSGLIGELSKEDTEIYDFDISEN